MAKKAQDQQLLEKVVCSIVEHPEDVRSERTIDDKGVLITLYVNPSDMRFVLGRDGKTATSLRTLLKAVGAKSKVSLSMKIFESPEAFSSHKESHPTQPVTAAGTEFVQENLGPMAVPVATRLPKAIRAGVKPTARNASAYYQESLGKMERRLGVEFKDKNLLLEALTHRSYLNEHENHPSGHNERLEFLGDAVLEIIITEHLFKRFPDLGEGVLTNYRAALVNATTLAPIAESFGLYDLMMMSKGERKDGRLGSKARMFISANAFEAVLGALYLDQGMGECRLFVDSALLVNLSAHVAEKAKDPKSIFQEEVQAKFRITPHYDVLDESGPKHKTKFVVGLFLKTLMIAKGEGLSKQEAQVAAAKLALDTKPQWEGRVAELVR